MYLMFNKKWVSLADMLQFFARDFAHQWQWLKAEKETAFESARKNRTPTQNDVNRITALLNGHTHLIGGKKGLKGVCGDLRLATSSHRLKRFAMVLNVKNSTPSFQVIHSELSGLEDSIWSELDGIKFAYISADKAHFFENPNYFGDEVNSFLGPNASEIKSACNCLAAEEPTAAIFHLMRVAEYGLRRVAKKLKVKLRHGIDESEWGSIITAIDRKIREIENTPRSARRDAKLAFCADILRDLRGFKHAWRNRVMHAKDTYNADDASAVLGHVGRFMKKVATELRKH